MLNIGDIWVNRNNEEIGIFFKTTDSAYPFLGKNKKGVVTKFTAKGRYIGDDFSHTKDLIRKVNV